MFLKWAGRTLVAAGLLVLLFAAYQLFGTGLVARQSQQRLQAQLEQQFRLTPPAASPSPGVSPEPSPAPSPSPAPPPEVGSGVAIIEIPRIGLRVPVVEGVGVKDLRLGPGHFPKSPMPGEQGNVVISGHRTTYGAPFGRLDEVRKGDVIRLVTGRGTFEYRTAEQRIVAPTEVSVIGPTRDSRLTLTTCHPRYSARQRLVVVAVLVTPEHAPAQEPSAA